MLQKPSFKLITDLTCEVTHFSNGCGKIWSSMVDGDIYEQNGKGVYYDYYDGDKIRGKLCSHVNFVGYG